MNPSFQSFSFGCRVNEAEKQLLDKRLLHDGYSWDDTRPTFFIINTCAVTGKAEREVRQFIYQTKKKYPETKIILTGCSATLWKNNSIDMPYADHIISNDEKNSIPDFLLSLLPLTKNKAYLSSAQKSSNDKFLTSGRLMVKIGDGCVRNCTYCIVPKLRGKPSNKTIKNIIKEIQSHDEPISEIILTAINTEYFGMKEKTSLWQLVDEILKRTNVPLVSFGSVNPWSFDDSFFQWYGVNRDNPRFMHFFHIPVQSGSDTVLARMHRGYKAREIGEKMKRIKEMNPKAFIGTDVIVGFPGETEKEFEETYEFLKKSPIDKLHVFRYSNRPGTEASKLKNEPTPQEKRNRSRKLIELGKDPSASSG